MSQTNALAMTPLPAEDSPVSKAPPLWFILKRHKWLILAGTVVGCVLGTALYVMYHRYDPLYKAQAVFIVRPQAPNPLQPRSANGGPTADINTLLRDQIILITNPLILQRALQSDAFQHPNRQANQAAAGSAWLAAHRADPLDALQNALHAAPIRNSNEFRLTMYWHDPRQTARIVNAVSTAYLQHVKNQWKARLQRDAAAVSAALNKQRTRVAAMQSALETYRAAHDIPGLIEQQTVLAGTLATLNAMLIQAQIHAKEAAENYQQIQKQVATNTLTLSPAMQQSVDDDAALSNLRMNLLSLQQEISVSKATLGVNHRATIALELRAASIRRQMVQRRQMLEARARRAMQETALAAVQAADALEADTRHRCTQQQRLVHDVDTALTEYQDRQAAIQNQQHIATMLNDRAVMLELRRASTDRAQVSLAFPAVAAGVMSFPNLKHFLGIGTILGLLAALALAYGLELTNTRVRSPRDVSSLLRLPLLGFLPEHRDDPLLQGDPMICLRTSPASMTAECFRQIRGRLAAAGRERPLQTILVASFSSAGGASTVASNLANGLALSELRVLLIDANFYRPVLKTTYPNIGSVGLADVLAERATLDEALTPCPELPTLFLLGCGTASKTPQEITAQRTFPDLMAQLRGRFDLILFDGAPLTFVSDSINLAARVDGVIGVVRANNVTRGMVNRIGEQLRQVRANFIGIVLNATQSWSAGYFRQHYQAFFDYSGAAVHPDQRQLPTS